MKQVWLRLAVSIAAMILFLERAESATQKIGDLTWNYEIVNGVAVIKPVGFGGGGSFTPAVSPCSGSLEIPSTLGGKPVREIDEYAFYCQYWLTSVYIPDSVRKIGACAFAMLGNNDSKLKVVSGGDGIEEIERDAFANCRCLESINIGDKLVKITGAFTDCVSLGDGWVVVNGWVLIYNGAFTSSVVVPEGVIGLSGALFRESKVKKVQLPSTLKYLGELTFYGSALESIAIPDGVLEIPYCAFEGCKSLQSIVIPKSVTNVDDTAFDYCSQLKLVCVDTGDIARISSLYKFGADVKIIECITMDDISVPYPVSALPTPTIRDNVKNKVLTLGTDYTIDSTNSSVPSGVGGGKIAIVMKGSYEGEYVFSYSVTKKDISRAVITLGDALTYDGKEQTQSITSVEVDALPVTFSVSGNTGTNAGEYTLTVTGSGNFTGEATKKWSISKKSIQGAEIVFGDELFFDGTWQEQSIANVMIDGLSATFSASNHVHRNSGTYELAVTGTGNFCGSAKKKFTIGRRDISSATISLGGSLTYNGKEQAQLVDAVTVDGLNATFDVSANLATDAGEYELTVNGTGNFTGSAKSKFTVSRKDIADAVVTLGDALTYNGQEQSQSVIGVKVDGIDASYTVSGNKATTAGEHELTIHGTGNFTGTAVRKFVVGRKDIADAEIVLGSPLTYNGKEQTQTVQGVTVDGLDASYTVSGNKATVAGNHTLTIIGTGNFTGSATKSFTVARKDISDAGIVLGAALVYNGKE